MAAAKGQRKCWLMFLLFIYEVYLPNSVQAVATSGTESGRVERVSRRQTGDIYFFINSNMHNFMSCGNENTSYLISEDECVKDQELFKGNKILY
jgi:5'(3')-deoxyribonucleotidase